MTDSSMDVSVDFSQTNFGNYPERLILRQYPYNIGSKM